MTRLHAAASVLLWARPDQDVLHPAGPQAGRIAELWSTYLTILAVVYVLVVGALLAAIWRRRAGGATEAREPALRQDELPDWAEPARAMRVLPEAGERARLRGVVGATLITIAVLFVMLVESVRTGWDLDRLTSDDAMHIQVIGQQWWWNVRYLDADPSQIVQTANEIHIPVGKTVVLELSATDVVHSFWVPNLHGKRDLVPGHDTSLVLRADAPGLYRGQCAEFCGHAHAQMALWVVAEPPAAFDAWRARQLRAPEPPASPAAQRGREVFLGGSCTLCHTVAGTPAQGSLGPDLSHVASRRSLAAASLPNTRGHLAGWIVNAQTLKPGSNMPNIGLSPADLQALLAYLETLR